MAATGLLFQLPFRAWELARVETVPIITRDLPPDSGLLESFSWRDGQGLRKPFRGWTRNGMFPLARGPIVLRILG